MKGENTLLRADYNHELDTLFPDAKLGTKIQLSRLEPVKKAIEYFAQMQKEYKLIELEDALKFQNEFGFVSWIDREGRQKFTFKKGGIKISIFNENNLLKFEAEYENDCQKSLFKLLSKWTSFDFDEEESEVEEAVETACV